MNKLIVAVTTAFCWAGFLCFSQCVLRNRRCQPRVRSALWQCNNPAQADGETTQQGFDAQNGNQWSTTSHKMGDFTFYSGLSSGNSWDGRQRVFGNGFNGPGFGSQNQAGSPRCAFYGAC